MGDGRAANKTVPTRASVPAFIRGLKDPRRREEAKVLLDLMKRASGEKPVLWGDSIVGFGRYDYHYDSGRSGTWFLTGFAPRKSGPVVYIMPGFKGRAALLRRLGQPKTSVSCLYLKRLEGLDLAALEELVAWSVQEMKRRYPKGGAR